MTDGAWNLENTTPAVAGNVDGTARVLPDGTSYQLDSRNAAVPGQFWGHQRNYRRLGHVELGHRLPDRADQRRPRAQTRHHPGNLWVVLPCRLTGIPGTIHRPGKA